MLRMPIGISEFGKLIRPQGDPYTFIDKTMFIKEVWEEGSEIILFTRPRRFGKTLNLSMLQHFFAANVGDLETQGLFEGLKITQHPELMKEQGRYPVIFVTFKELKHREWPLVVSGMQTVFRRLFQSHNYLEQSERLAPFQKDIFKQYRDTLQNLDLVGLSDALYVLCELLYKHYGQKVWILLDEYDTPAQAGYLNGYLPEIMDLMRNMFSLAFKGNPYIHKGVITGITRVAKENLFSGLNNIRVHSTTSPRFSDSFGFTEEEVESLVSPEHMEEMRTWYNGYRFGDDAVIYNPWSVIYCIDDNMSFQPHWVNTGNSELIESLLTHDHLESMQTLLGGGVVDFYNDDHVVFEDLKVSEDAFWGVLYMAGYLTRREDGYGIPNKEIRDFYARIVKRWFVGRRSMKFFDEWIDSLLAGNLEKVRKALQVIFVETLSFHDMSENNQESFFHGFMTGLLAGLRETHVVKSNRESGYGRYDIAILPKDPGGAGVIIEVKASDTAEAALKQIEEQAYVTELKQHGCSRISIYGIGFTGKKISVVGAMVAL